MFAIIKLPITDPSGPALSTPVAVSETELTVALDRPSTGPTQIAYYTLERSVAGSGSFAQVAQGLEIFPFSDTGLTAETSYTYRARATDTTDRNSEWGYTTGTTDASETVDPADYTIAAGTSSSTFEGSVVSPGEIVEFAAGTHGTRTIQNLQGTALNPIIVRSSASGRTTIRRNSASSNGFVLWFRNCRYVEVDGGYTDGETYGILVRYAASGADAPSSFIQFGDNSTGLSNLTPFEHLTVRNVEVDGGWLNASSTNGVGIQFNDGSYFTLAGNPAVVRDGFLVENCYVHHTEGEGMYIGPNWYQGHVPLKNVTVRNCTFTDTGWDGFQIKSVVDGTNAVYGNTVLRAGRHTVASAGQHYGISVTSGSFSIYRNWIADSGEHSISAYIDSGPPASAGYGPFTVSIYNNVCIRPGTYFVTGKLNPDGIVVGASSSTVEKYEPAIYNNTIIDAASNAVAVNSNIATGFVKNNLAIDSVSTPITVPGGVVATNNPTSASFVNAGTDDYHLTAASAAVGTIGVDIAASDYDGDPRVAGAADCGAYEYP
jgi:hypothetical protein